MPAPDNNNVRAWQRRKPWTRTDTARWLNGRNEPLLAWLRRKTVKAPSHSNQMGYWLKEHAVEIFDRAHKKLAGYATDADREAVLIDEVLR